MIPQSLQRKPLFVDKALNRPIAILSLITALLLGSFYSMVKMPRDILPDLGIPTIYVAQPFGGMSASQMESYVTYYYEYHFLYIAGIASVESKNIASTALIKLEFHPGTDMAQALAETVGYVNRARAFMPDGLVSPFVMRFDAGGAPVGKLVFSSSDPNRTLPQLQTLALNSVRPLFATLPGVSAPPPFGGSQRTILINLDPAKLRKANLSASDVAQALGKANKIVPSGNLLADDKYPVVSLNSVVTDIQELADVPIRLGTLPTISIKDVGTVVDGADIQTGYALVNGQRTVYIPVTKRSNASTLSVVNLVKENMGKFQSVLPDDVTVGYQFDQSGIVTSSISTLILEGILGALFASLMIFIFLRSWRSAFIVVITIPLSIAFSLLALWLCGQTVNIMTLGGLALSIGVLVDEITVTIENIHSQFGPDITAYDAISLGSAEILKPAFLTLLSVLAVFVPVVFMTGVSKALFLPLSLAVGFSVIGSFLLSRTLVPLLMLKLFSKHSHSTKIKPIFAAAQYSALLTFLFSKKKTVFLIYLPLCILLIYCGKNIGRELFPQVDSGQLQLRLRAPVGTALAKTEKLTIKVLDSIKQELGADNLTNSVSFVGMQPPSYPINTIHQWSSGTHEAVVEVAVKPSARLPMDTIKERLRKRILTDSPELGVSFEISSLLDRILGQGAVTPIEIVINGQNLKNDREFAKKIESKLHELPYLRDIHYAQSFDYPSIAVTASRAKAGTLGLTMNDIGQALVPATSSSRFILQNYWADPKSGVNFQVQVQVPQGTLKSAEELKELTASVGGGAIPLKNFAEFSPSTTLAESDRINMQRIVTLRANLFNKDLGSAGREIETILSSLAEEKPKGTDVLLKGQWLVLQQMLQNLGIGIGIALLAIFLFLAANFESPVLALIVLSTTPATLAGVVIALFITHTTINVESFIGTIMALGVSIANSILLVSFAENQRLKTNASGGAALFAATHRLRPILMTSLAMIVGMIPMAIGLGEGSEQTTPLARAVIGGLFATTFATLFVLPLIYGTFRKNISGDAQ